MELGDGFHQMEVHEKNVYIYRIFIVQNVFYTKPGREMCFFFFFVKTFDTEPISKFIVFIRNTGGTSSFTKYTHLFWKKKTNQLRKITSVRWRSFLSRRGCRRIVNAFFKYNTWNPLNSNDLVLWFTISHSFHSVLTFRNTTVTTINIKIVSKSSPFEHHRPNDSF